MSNLAVESISIQEDIMNEYREEPKTVVIQRLIESRPQLFSTFRKRLIQGRLRTRSGVTWRAWKVTPGHYILIDDELAISVRVNEDLEVSTEDLAYIPRWLSKLTGIETGSWIGDEEGVDL